MALLDLLGKPIAFHRIYATICNGDTSAALLLSQAVYWQNIVEKGTSGKSMAGEKYFYKTQIEWNEETTLSSHQQLAARKKLRQFNFWREKKCGIPRKLYYRVDLQQLLLFIADFAQKSQQNHHNSESATQASQKRYTSVADLRNKHLKNATLPIDYPETTTETTTTPPTPPGGEGDGLVAAAGGDEKIEKYLKFATLNAQKDPKIKSISGYMIKIKKRIKSQNGLSEVDLAQLKAWQTAEIIEKIGRGELSENEMPPAPRPESVPFDYEAAQ